MAGSRLDRLVGLLDNGSTPLIRSTAAEQLAQVQKLHPDGLLNLVSRVLPHLWSKSWDTRTAAARAIGLIIEYAEAWDPNGESDIKTERDSLDDTERVNGESARKGVDRLENNISKNIKQLPIGKLRFASVDMNEILHNNRPLVGSTGDEYDVLHLDLSDRLATQKRGLTSRLGIGGEYIQDELMNAQDIAIESNGFESQGPNDSNASNVHPASISGIQSTQADLNLKTADSHLSARQKNAMKRKAKVDARGSNKLVVVRCC